MKSILITFALSVTASLALAQEKVSRDEALTYAQLAGADRQQLKGTPLATDVDLEQPVAMKDEEFGGMVLPQKGLKAEALASAGSTAVPIGQLWLHKLTPMRDGQAVASDRLRLAKVSVDGDERKVPQCTLAVRRNAASKLELLVLGKSAEPLLTASLDAVDARSAAPIDLDAERQGDSGKLTLTVLGKYRAAIQVTELEL